MENEQSEQPENKELRELRQRLQKERDKIIFNAGIDAALEALPEKRPVFVDPGENIQSAANHSFNGAIEEARQNIERKRK